MLGTEKVSRSAGRATAAQAKDNRDIKYLIMDGSWWLFSGEKQEVVDAFICVGPSLCRSIHDYGSHTWVPRTCFLVR